MFTKSSTAILALLSTVKADDIDNGSPVQGKEALDSKFLQNMNDVDHDQMHYQGSNHNHDDLHNFVHSQGETHVHSGVHSHQVDHTHDGHSHMYDDVAHSHGNLHDVSVHSHDYDGHSHEIDHDHMTDHVHSDVQHDHAENHDHIADHMEMDMHDDGMHHDHMSDDHDHTTHMHSHDIMDMHDMHFYDAHEIKHYNFSTHTHGNHNGLSHDHHDEKKMGDMKGEIYDHHLDILSHDLSESYQYLGPMARMAIEAAQSKMFDYKKYKFGMLIPTYGLPADPLEYDCLSGYEVWDSPNCGQRTSAKPINKGKWHDIMHHLNLYSHDP